MPTLSLDSMAIVMESVAGIYEEYSSGTWRSWPESGEAINDALSKFYVVDFLKGRMLTVLQSSHHVQSSFTSNNLLTTIHGFQQ